MAFIPAVRNARPSFEGLPRGQCSIARSGMGLFLAGDLAAVDISDQVAVLVDAGNGRIALRRPRLPEDECCVQRTCAVKRKNRNASDRRHVNLVPALRALGINPKVAGGARFDLVIHEDLLILGVAVPSQKRIAKKKVIGGHGRPAVWDMDVRS